METNYPLWEYSQILAEGYHCKIDIGHVTGGDYPQGRYFGNGIGLGFDAVVGFEAAKTKYIGGALSYLVAVVKTIFLYSRAPIYEVIYDDTTLQQPFLMVSLMNGKRMGGAFMMAPQGNPGDGHFDLCLVGHVSQPGILRLVPKFISGTQGNHPAVKMPPASRIRIRAVEGTIPAHADGETLCTAGQELTIKMHPAALDVITHNGGNHN
jgi:diacylglycerol kinase (ATP)